VQTAGHNAPWSAAFKNGKKIFKCLVFDFQNMEKKRKKKLHVNEKENENFDELQIYSD
jgi:hypothetical protein